MANLFHIKCLKIIDNQQEEDHVEIVECFHKKITSVVFIGQEVLEILMFVINGDKDTLKDNGIDYSE